MNGETFLPFYIISDSLPRIGVLRDDPAASSLSVSRTSDARDEHEGLGEEKADMKSTTEVRRTGNLSRSTFKTSIGRLGEKDLGPVQLLLHQEAQTFSVCPSSFFHFNSFLCSGYTVKPHRVNVCMCVGVIV